MNEPYASGNWVVMQGREKEFVERWNEFLEWTRTAFTECKSARLLQDAEDSRHFVSFANWDSAEARQRWRSTPEFAQKFGVCRALCDDFRGTDYMLSAMV